MLKALICSMFLASSPILAAIDYDVRVPGEVEQTGGYSGALNNTGVSFIEGSSATKINPALLVETKQYVVSGSYHWPVAGREYYEVGVVDGVTSKYVAGVSYNGYQEDYKINWENGYKDSSVMKRATVAMALPLKYLAIGGSATYIEGFDVSGVELRERKAVTLGFGAYGKITEYIKLGASVQNFNNESLRNTAPMTLRAGASVNLFKGQFLVGLDYKQRQRLALNEISVLATEEDSLNYLKDDEKMAYLSSVVKIYDVVRLMGSYGLGVFGDTRKSASAGLGLAQGGYTFYYTIGKPYMSYKEYAHSVSLSFLMKM